MAIIDVVTEEEYVLESRDKEEVHRLGLLHREIHVWFYDKDKNIYFQQSGKQSPSAGLFDATVGGHVDSGEDYLEGAVRETQEEVDILVNPRDLILLNKFRAVSEYKGLDKTNNFLRSVYIYKNPVSDSEIRDGGENDGFKKFSLDFIKNMKEEDLKLFHRWLPTQELPYVIKYLNTL